MFFLFEVSFTCLELAIEEAPFHMLWFKSQLCLQQWFFTVADAIRVSDDLARFHLQYTYFHRPIFGAHGSFLLTNGFCSLRSKF